ncbi:MAG TPA: GTPase HflX [candidate division Zixibacteria bacterium]|nr:GTPase HflX [candidate division Zixibacteria bacterium]
MKSFLHETSKRKIKQRAILVGIYKKSDKAVNDDEPLDELASLCRTAGAIIVGRMTQLVERFSPATLMGSGKVEELAELAKREKADIVVFDTILAPSQQVNLEKRLSKQVIDRPGLILDIFAIHAKTREARTQVELAQMQYLLPRLAGGWTHLERQEGAIGTRGPGETQLETDRRLVRKRIGDLKKKLSEIEGERQVQRKGRSDLFNICLVGYTNAGKSTVFNKLTGERVLAEDYLFATLDSTTRRVKLSRRNEVLLSDTVGFISRLPVSLVASFKSTLLEASEADLLLHVVDLSDENFEERISTVNTILQEIGAGEIPILPIFNKIDLKNDPDLYRAILGRFPGAHFISATTKEGLPRLIADLETYLERSRVTIEITVDASNGRILKLINSLAYIVESRATDETIELKVRLPKSRLGKLKGQGVDFRVIDES